MNEIERGQSLFELIVAVSLVAIVLIALVGLSVRAVANTDFSKNQSLASRYSQEGVEWLRGQRDEDWLTFTSRSSGNANGRTWCLNNLSWGNSGNCGGNEVIPNTPFFREASLRTVNARTIEAIVVSAWIDGSGRHEARAATLFTDWRAR